MPQVCNRCNDLNWYNFGATRSFSVSLGDVQSAAQQGCKLCSLILMAMAEFVDSLAAEHQEIYKTNKIQNIHIYVIRRGMLSLGISFHSCYGDPSSLSLELIFSSGKLHVEETLSLIAERRR